MTQICLLCKREFKASTSTQKYCSAKCRNKHIAKRTMRESKYKSTYKDGRKEMECKYCGKKLDRSMINEKGHLSPYCNEEHKQLMSGKGICKFCFNFYTDFKNEPFCSSTCRRYYADLDEHERLRLASIYADLRDKLLDLFLDDIDDIISSALNEYKKTLDNNK